MSLRLKTLVLAASLLQLGFTLESQAAPHSAKAVNATAIKQIVKDSDILPSEYQQQVYAAYSNGEASISLFRHPQSTRADCKIDGVLLARHVIGLDPAKVKVVRCFFYDYDRQNEYWEVEVRANLVRAYADGKIGRDELVDSVLLQEDRQANALSDKFAATHSYKAILDADGVVPGALSERRLAASLRLKELKRQGVDVSAFHDDFLRVEDAARRGNEQQVATLLASLYKQIDEHVQSLISSGQLTKQEMLRRSKNALGSQPDGIQKSGSGSSSGSASDAMEQ